jgi:hypothetical protein
VVDEEAASAALSCTISDWFLLTLAKIGSKWTARMLLASSAPSTKRRPSAPIWFGEAIALHPSVGIASRMAAEITFVHLITTLPKHSGRAAIPAARKATSTMTIPNSVEVNEVPDANRIQSNCSQWVWCSGAVFRLQLECCVRNDSI